MSAVIWDKSDRKVYRRVVWFGHVRQEAELKMLRLSLGVMRTDRMKDVWRHGQRGQTEMF